MRKTMHKWFWSWEHEKEEQWLNTMAAKGWALVSVGFATYEFEECQPGEYNFRIELLEHSPNSFEGKEYISFIEETGATQVGQFVNWIYFRKKTVDGPFDLFSDFESKIKHFKRIFTMMFPVGLINLYIGLQNIMMYFKNGFSGSLIGIVNLLCSGLLLFGCFKVKQKMDQLKKEKQIFE